jgi:hypothetical protein
VPHLRKRGGRRLCSLAGCDVAENCPAGEVTTLADSPVIDMISRGSRPGSG